MLSCITSSSPAHLPTNSPSLAGAPSPGPMGALPRMLLPIRPPPAVPSVFYLALQRLVRSRYCAAAVVTHHWKRPNPFFRAVSPLRLLHELATISLPRCLLSASSACRSRHPPPVRALTCHSQLPVSRGPPNGLPQLSCQHAGLLAQPFLSVWDFPDPRPYPLSHQCLPVTRGSPFLLPHRSLSLFSFCLVHLMASASSFGRRLCPLSTPPMPSFGLLKFSASKTEIIIWALHLLSLPQNGQPPPLVPPAPPTALELDSPPPKPAREHGRPSGLGNVCSPRAGTPSAVPTPQPGAGNKPCPRLCWMHLPLACHPGQTLPIPSFHCMRLWGVLCQARPASPQALPRPASGLSQPPTVPAVLSLPSLLLSSLTLSSS